MPKIDFILGYPERGSNAKSESSSKKELYLTKKVEYRTVAHSPITTYYANAQLFSRRTPQNRKREIGRLYKNVLDD